jgi:hypothetical protein
VRVLSCKENKSSFEFKYPKSWQANLIKVDGGLITDNTTTRCDYIITAQAPTKEASELLSHTIIYIELKGCDLMKAIAQLESSIKIFRGEYNRYENKHARAVCSHIVPFITSAAQVATVRFKKTYNVQLKWHSQRGQHIINN